VRWWCDRQYTENTDGSYIEDKESAIVWHYEQADPEFGRMQASELAKYLVKVIDAAAVDVVRYDYNRILEIKPKGVGKGLTASLVLDSVLGAADAASSATPPFVLCVGDDRADEEMFLALQATPRLMLDPSALPSELKEASPMPSPAAHVKHIAASATASASASASAGGASTLAPPGVVRESAAERDRRLQSAGASSRALYQPSLFTTTVGIKPSSAHYYCNDSDEVSRVRVLWTAPLLPGALLTVPMYAVCVVLFDR
jgi:hypothetical protein